jgi:NAD+ synthase (glutamine-hydrolysing)
MVNSIGGNDELIFDGTSMVFDRTGRLSCLLKSFAEDHAVIDTENLQSIKTDFAQIEMPDAEQALGALVLGVRDYFHKCGFTKAVLGLSGGIDSAVTACIAAQALGPSNVLAVMMPSRYTSQESIRDGEALAKNLGIETRLMSIEGPFKAYLNLFEDEFKGLKPDITEENFQARIRGNILMGFANKYGHLLLTTGNKSELAVGYCTLYGDMSGGLAVLSDVPKTLVYEIAVLINREKEIIPTNTITRPPSAELRPDQTDQETLPPYEQLDKIIRYYVEDEKDLDEIAGLGFERELTKKVIQMIDGAEYKRRQMPVGLKVTGRAFGFGRRMPVAQRYHRNTK